MTYPADPDFSAVEALPDADLNPELNSLAGAIRRTTNEVRGTASGEAPEAATKAADDAAAATDELAENARLLAEGTKILKDAARKWQSDAPKKADLEAADQKLVEAIAAEENARKAFYDMSESGRGVITPILNAAAMMRLEAEKKLNDMKRQRAEADKEYEDSRNRAAQLVQGLKGSEREGGSDTRSGELPGGASTTDTDSESSGSGNPPTASSGASTTGASAAGTPAGGAKAGSSSGAAAPASASPATAPSSATSIGPISSSGKSDSSNDALATLLAAQAGQQQQPAAQVAPQQQTPMVNPAAMQNPQQGQNGKQNDGSTNSTGSGQDILDLDDVNRLLGENGAKAGAVVAGLGGAAAAAGAGLGAPTTSTSHSTSFRPSGTEIAGTTAGGTPAAAPSPATTGTSEYGLKTGADVSGRSGSLANALAMPPNNSSTSTSGAHGPSQGANPLGQRTGTGGAMPHMPMMPPMGGGMGAPSGGGQRSGDGKDNRPRKASTTLELLNGEDSIAEAVRGGTIAQNRPDNPSRTEK